MRKTVAAIFLALVALAPASRAENLVYLKLNPLSFAVHGATPAPEPGPYGSHPAWLPDLFGIGFAAGALDLSFQMTELNPFPANDTYSLLYARFAVGWRPLKAGPISVFDPYVFGGAGGGGAGRYATSPAGCVSTPQSPCARAREGWGGGAFAGVGLDGNFTVARLETGQRVIVSVGLELRAELFYTPVPSEAFNYFTVFALPVSLKLE